MQIHSLRLPKSAKGVDNMATQYYYAYPTEYIKAYGHLCTNHRKAPQNDGFTWDVQADSFFLVG